MQSLQFTITVPVQAQRSSFAERGRLQLQCPSAGVQHTIATPTTRCASSGKPRGAASGSALAATITGTITHTIRTPLADVLRDHALIHLPPAAARAPPPRAPLLGAGALLPALRRRARRRAAPRVRRLRLPLLRGGEGFVPFDAAADTVPSPSLAFLPAASAPTALSSSHGVACCFSLADDAYFVCNPATSAWTGVLSPPSRTWPRPAVVVLFDAGAYNFRGDYALVCAFESAPGSGTYCFAVFTSGAGEWWVPDAVAPAEGLVPESGVAAGGTAWWRTSIGTAVGYNPVTGGGVEVAMCPGDSGHWEIGSVGDRLHCAVLAGNDVVVFRLDGRDGWEEAARVGVMEMLQSWTPPEHMNESDDEAEEANNTVLQRLLPFQGAEVEVVVLSGSHVVAFDAVTRRRRVAALPDPPEGKEWRDAEYVAHTNTLAMVAPAVLVREPGITQRPNDDREAAASSSS
ncbi:hypothetical protein PR202_gb10759 [Eleusine coracana subsp. coracana]|uniref:Uncharacterized protein n=1 Tax=Eleusine coracana subsp. coracana TaxID=191504 RepID=A0AAV5ELB4_ELECO|nr:hypothetical protein PR202_gb10759 [Eleusine coracana subsp. coracana]